MSDKMSDSSKEYTFTGSVELRGVVFYIRATSESEAREMAKRGEFDDFETNTASAVNCEIKAETCARND